MLSNLRVDGERRERLAGRKLRLGRPLLGVGIVHVGQKADKGLDAARGEELGADLVRHARLEVDEVADRVDGRVDDGPVTAQGSTQMGVRSEEDRSLA